MKPGNRSRRWEGAGMGGQDKFTEAVRSTVKRHAMFAPGQSILAGVSGGLDSVVLLAVLTEFCASMGLFVHVCYVHHGLRPQADEDERFVAALAAKWQHSFSARRVSVPAARSSGRSLEEAARTLRYEALAQAARAAGAERIAVAHHRDDQVETVLMRFLTGAGPDGLAGMPAVHGSIVRPLIDRSRAEITAFARHRGLEFREDASNRDIRLLRNRIRHRLVPDLEAEYNPRIRQAIWRLSRLAADETSFLDHLAAEAEAVAFASFDLFRALPLVSLKLPELQKLPAALQRRIVRRVCWRVLGEQTAAVRLGYDEAEAVRDLIKTETELRAVDLPGGLRVRRTVDRLHCFARWMEEDPGFSGYLPVPGTLSIGRAGIKLQADYAPPDRGPDGGLWRIALSGVELGPEDVLTVDNPRPEDRLALCRGAEPRKLRNLMSERQIPEPLRGLLPVIRLAERPVAVIGMGADQSRDPGRNPRGRAVVIAAVPIC
ncbi:MAG: tRNA lysidine(34) synthetase TilS [Thermaerobacterales bacterium]